MALSSSALAKIELPSKPSVQEILKNAPQQVPERYICQQLPKKSSSGDDDHSELAYMDSCIIDVGLLSSSSLQEREEELRKLQSVLTSWGCLQVVNHGVSSSLLDKIRKVGKEFFALPLEMKQKHIRTLEWYEGYGGDTVGEGHSYNWNDRLLLRVHPPQQRNFTYWPEYLPTFRETLEEYAVELKRVLKIILKAIAKVLNVEEDRVFNACGGEENVNMLTRFNYYPPCSTPDQVIGLKPHSDTTALTILLQDKQVEGLQVEKDGQWFRAPIIPDAFFINVGDQLEIMSNGILKSAVHKLTIDKERERMSVVMACAPPLEYETKPLSELIDDQRPQRYKGTKNYVGVFFTYYSRGERAINDFKI